MKNYLKNIIILKEKKKKKRERHTIDKSLLKFKICDKVLLYDGKKELLNILVKLIFTNENMVCIELDKCHPNAINGYCKK